MVTVMQNSITAETHTVLARRKIGRLNSPRINDDEMDVVVHDQTPAFSAIFRTDLQFDVTEVIASIGFNPHRSDNPRVSIHRE